MCGARNQAEKDRVRDGVDIDEGEGWREAEVASEGVEDCRVGFERDEGWVGGGGRGRGGVVDVRHFVAMWKL